MKKTVAGPLSAIAILFFFGGPIDAHAINRVEFYRFGDISAGAGDYDWGVTYSFSAGSEDGRFNAYNPYPFNTDYKNTLTAVFSSYDGFDRVNYTFSTDGINVPLQVGKYEDARSNPSIITSGHPGFTYEISGDAGTHLITRFEIFDYTLSESGAVSSFAASFQVYGIDPLFVFDRAITAGRIWINSDATMPAVPEPSKSILTLVGLGCVLFIRWRRSYV